MVRIRDPSVTVGSYSIVEEGSGKGQGHGAQDLLYGADATYMQVGSHLHIQLRRALAHRHGCSQAGG